MQLLAAIWKKIEINRTDDLLNGGKLTMEYNS